MQPLFSPTGNIGPNITEDVIRQYFSMCGDILYSSLSGDAAQGSRFAFVEFKTLDSKNKAMLLTGSTLGDRQIKYALSLLFTFLLCHNRHGSG